MHMLYYIIHVAHNKVPIRQVAQSIRDRPLDKNETTSVIYTRDNTTQSIVLIVPSLTASLHLNADEPSNLQFPLHSKQIAA